MQRRCAWCGRNLQPGGTIDDPRVTHGICPACSAKFVEECERLQPGEKRPAGGAGGGDGVPKK